MEGVVVNMGYEPEARIHRYGSVGAVPLSAIGKIEDFAKPGNLAAYFGLVLRVQNSNERNIGAHHQARQQAGAHGTGPMFASGRTIQPLSAEVLSTHPAPP
jgi:hypothetical protein